MSVTAARVLDQVLILVNGNEVARISPEDAITLGARLEEQASLALLAVNHDDSHIS